ncbi:MAG TPA: O-antigen ligase family protein [Pyrinomonadaceae bacterium]|nr:O-antigen ligase family protein [Pyrinomonadaceae bacterium]
MKKLTGQNNLQTNLPLPVALLLISLVLPVELSFYAGDLLITPARLVLLLMAFPLISRITKCGDLQKFDFLLLGFVLWITVSYTFNHGIGKAIEGGGVLGLEILAGYFIARIYISDLEKLAATIRFTLLMLMLMLPLVVMEAITGKHFIHDFFRSLTGFYYPVSDEVRIGFTRASGSFNHPILLGVFSSSLLGLVWHLFGERGKSGRFQKVLILTGVTLTTLSSAPILLLLLQLCAIAWNRLAGGFKSRWKLVAAAFASLYVFLMFWSPTSPLIVILSRITFDAQTSYYRRLIWEYGSAEVINNPVFGIGKNDWVRPVWMISDTIDNFWLKMAMQFGIPALILLILCVFLIAFKVNRLVKENLSKEFQLVCRGWLISIISLSFVGCTVDFFGSNHVYFYFLLGIGAALINMPDKPERSKKFAENNNQNYAG